MKKKRAAAERFVRLTHRMMETRAWQSLNGNARAIYVELVMLYRGVGNQQRSDRIFGTAQAAQAIHVSKDTAARALKSPARSRRFIVSITKGCFCP